jgi:hypothetical protein
VASFTQNINHDCRCFPGEHCWPKAHEWNTLNETLDGRLLATVPLGSPCHDPKYDAKRCVQLLGEWRFSSVQ